MVAGEASGDILGASLISSLKQRYPNARFIGIGGPKMQSSGLESWYPMESLSVMGFFEVLKHLRELLHLRKELIRRLLELRPDVFIGIDAPDFNFTVERTLKQHKIPTVHYVGPSVWAWREKRLEKIKKSTDGVLVLFPFEPPYYDRYDIPVRFVGHPLAHRFPEQPDKQSARLQLKLPLDAPITAILPGSRMSEIERMIDPYLQAAAIMAQDYPQMQFVIPCVHAKARQRIELAVERFGDALAIHLIDQHSQQVLEACDQVMVTSGTATLECALMKKPMVISIKLHPVSYWIMKRLATTQWIGLPNILAGKSLVKELIQEEASPENIANAMLQVISDSNLRQKQIAAFEEQHQQLKLNASELAADAIQKWAGLS